MTINTYMQNKCGAELLNSMIIADKLDLSWACSLRALSHYEVVWVEYLKGIIKAWALSLIALKIPLGNFTMSNLIVIVYMKILLIK